jgi:hypothetical protein
MRDFKRRDIGARLFKTNNSGLNKNQIARKPIEPIVPTLFVNYTGEVLDRESNVKNS